MNRMVGIVLAILLAMGCGQRSPEVRKTIGKNREWMATHLKEYLREISRDERGKVQFVATSLLTSEFAEHNHPNRFKLGLGEKFFQPDDHGTITFVLKEVNSSGVVIGYEEKFNHRSFGRNLITIDEGEVKVAYTK